MGHHRRVTLLHRARRRLPPLLQARGRLRLDPRAAVAGHDRLWSYRNLPALQLEVTAARESFNFIMRREMWGGFCTTGSASSRAWSLCALGLAEVRHRQPGGVCMWMCAPEPDPTLKRRFLVP